MKTELLISDKIITKYIVPKKRINIDDVVFSETKYKVMNKENFDAQIHTHVVDFQDVINDFFSNKNNTIPELSKKYQVPEQLLNYQISKLLKS